jgi:D-alanyl-lipoteichoic acid acyltransferase DltB (MBOAT superfamily)
LKLFLLAASYVFYGWWDWRFLGLIAGSSAVNHLLALAMARHAHGRPIGRLLGLGTVVLTLPPLTAQALIRAGAGARLAAGVGLGPEIGANTLWCAAGALAFVLAGRVASLFGAGLYDAPPARVRTGMARALGGGAVIVNLGFLGFFKYYGFFVQNAYALCGRLGLSCPLPLLDIVLPVGISFFTFQALSYVLDVHRGEIAPAPSLLDFAIYLAFFPQLVAGPIVRARVFLPQLIRLPVPDRLDVGRAAVLIFGGLFKKVVVANFLAQSIVDPVFGHPAIYGAWDTLFAVYAYAVQIYCDFSAYSDIAIGTALLLGFHFPINFDAPYFSASVQAFWRRWHISLSSWLRDYLYIPLGGSRCSPRRTYLNLFLTFLLGGLWHGAGWTFIAWGALHGFYLCVERLLRGGRPPPPSSFGRRLAGQLVTFHLVCLSWFFFRAESFEDAWTLLGNFGQWARPECLNLPVLAMAVLGFASQGLDGRRVERWWDAFGRWPTWAQALAAAAALTVILGLGPRGVAPFIYFQF